MKKNIVTLFFLLVPCLVKSEAFITEIINNTDLDVFVRTKDSIGAYVAKNGQTKCLKPSGSNGFLCIRGRCMIADLKIPVVSASNFYLRNSPLTAGHLKDSDRSVISFFYSRPTTTEIKSRQMDFFGIQQRGGCLDVLKGEGLRNIYLNDHIFSPGTYFEKIEDNATYTIEINQLLDTIKFLHKGIRCNFKGEECINLFHLVPDEVDVIIRRNTITTNDVAIKNLKTLAYIEEFTSTANGLIKVEIAFENLETQCWLENFYNYLLSNKLVNEMAQVNWNKNFGRRGFSILFYTNITRDEVKKLIDNASKAISNRLGV